MDRVRHHRSTIACNRRVAVEKLALLGDEPDALGAPVEDDAQIGAEQLDRPANVADLLDRRLLRGRRGRLGVDDAVECDQIQMPTVGDLRQHERGRPAGHVRDHASPVVSQVRLVHRFLQG